MVQALEAQLEAVRAQLQLARADIERRADVPKAAALAVVAPANEREPTWFAPDPGAQGRDDPLRELRFAPRYPTTLPLIPPVRRFDPEQMRIHWIMKEVLAGGGGATTILRIIRRLEHAGHRNTIWLTGQQDSAVLKAIRNEIEAEHGPLQAALKPLTATSVRQIEGDAVIATHYSTAYPARAVQRVRQRFYFIQDFEPDFDPRGTRYYLAEATYRFGFHAIAASTWLRDLMRNTYGLDADLFDLAVDHDVYKPLADIARRPQHIAFYARPQTPRRAVELGLMALELASAAHPELTVDMFGWEWGGIDVPYKYVDHGVLRDEAELSAIYNRASLGMVFSATNVSLVPREMMACGLPVIELESPSTLAAFAGGVAALCRPDPTTIANTISTLMANPDQRAALSQRGLAHVAALDWNTSAAQVEEALREGILRNDPVGHVRLLRWRESGPASRTLRQVDRLTHRRAKTAFSFQRPLAWVGQAEYFRCAYHDDLADAAGLEFPITSADPHRLRALPEFVRRHDVRTIVMFRPEWLAERPDVLEELRELGVAIIGYSSEPVPHDWSNPHRDQVQRLQSLLRARDLDLDLLIHYDAWSLALLEELGFPRVIAHPLPTSSALFFPRDLPQDFDVCFTGKSTPYRETFLMPLKARCNVVHAAHGLTDQECATLMQRSRLVLNIHNEPYANYEHRVMQALFCERPVLSEPLSGGYLAAEDDYVEFRTPTDLLAKVEDALRNGGISAPKIDLSPWVVGTLTRRLGLDG
jgi:glycosyltransferase involved in cell wall biosynthesis